MWLGLGHVAPANAKLIRRSSLGAHTDPSIRFDYRVAISDAHNSKSSSIGEGQVCTVVISAWINRLNISATRAAIKWMRRLEQVDSFFYVIHLLKCLCLALFRQLVAEGSDARMFPYVHTAGVFC